MASHHHHPQPYNAYHCPTPTTAAAAATNATCYCCCSCSNYTPCHCSPPPDSRLPPVSPYLHHSTPPPPPPQPHFHSPYTPQSHQFHPSQSHHHNAHYFHEIPLYHHHHQQQEEEQIQPLISSLLRRISALETSLKRCSISASYSLRDAAARTIQTHFRAFLVHRSRTLGQLQELASIKSKLNALKSSLSRNAYFDSRAISLKIMDMLLKLDSIQGVDPMIRDGKRSLSRELNRFIELIGGGSFERSELSSRIVKNVRGGGKNNKSRVEYSDNIRGNINSAMLGKRGDGTVNVREQIRRVNELDLVDEHDDESYEDLIKLQNLLARKNGVSVGRSGGINGPNGHQSKLRKRVSFAENNEVYKVIRSHNESNSVDGSDSADDDQELIDNCCKEIEDTGVSSRQGEDDEEEAHTEDEGSPPSSDGGSDEINSVRSRDEARKTSYQTEDGTFTFCAPLPVKMEARVDIKDRMK